MNIEVEICTDDKLKAKSSFSSSSLREPKAASPVFRGLPYSLVAFLGENLMGLFTTPDYDPCKFLADGEFSKTLGLKFANGSLVASCIVLSINLLMC